MPLDQLTILAPGLLGGSVARAARERDAARKTVIWARDAGARAELASQPWCDRVADTPEDAARDAELVVIATPVDAIVPLAARISGSLKPASVVTDVGSVKGRIAREGHAAVGAQGRFVGSHPMAGSEKTGWKNGSANLFEGRTCFVTPLPDTDPAALEKVRAFWTRLGARVSTVDPGLHDEIVAHISHLPQVLASSLCSFLAGKDPAWRDYSGGGLKDTTRIAASDPKVWLAILQENRAEILKALAGARTELATFEEALARGDWEDMTARLRRAREYRMGISGS